MLDDHEVNRIRQTIADRRQVLEKALGLLAEIESSLADQEKAMERYEQAQTQFRKSDAAHALLQILTGTGVMSLGDTEAERKSNVKIYEEVIIAYGQPMHPSNIVSLAEARGVVFQGNVKKARQVRNSMYGSKRFTNIGDNIWWVVGKPVPISDDDGRNPDEITAESLIADAMSEVLESPRELIKRGLEDNQAARAEMSTVPKSGP